MALPANDTTPSARGAAGAARLLSMGAAVTLLLVSLLPIVALVTASSPGALATALSDPLLLEALALSLGTTFVSLLLSVVTGTPLAWLLARRRGRWIGLLQTAIELPIVIPPAVVGLGLLLTFGRNGLLGGPLAWLGVSIPFTPLAVVLAQVVVAAPFYVQAATIALRSVPDDRLLVARTLGASATRTFTRIVIPSALPGLLGGMALCWARALGEFGATLLFAGNLPGRTQTMPLAIYSALEIDVELATTIALVLGALAFFIMVAVRIVRAWMMEPKDPEARP